MAPVLRIKPPAVQADDAGGGAPPDPAKDYVERLVRLIPAEVVSIYLAGKSGIQAAFPPNAGAHPAARFISENAYWVGWTIFCFVAVIIIRAWATSDRRRNIAPEWPAVGIAAGSFLIWVYSLGGVFGRPNLFPGLEQGIWEPLLAMLLVFAWTLVVPIVYRQD